MRATTEPERRVALILATSTYQDAAFRKLRAPGNDASRLAEVLAAPDIGGFEVETALNETADVVRRRIAQFCEAAGPRDLALVYLSCHGVLDLRGRLYYATADTEHDLLSVTAVAAPWLNDRLEDSMCRRQILVLDCCHSGAFARGSKGDPTLDLEKRFEARGRIVITASRATEYSFESEVTTGDAQTSFFTGALVEGLESGNADSDEDGLVTVDELFDYASHALRVRGVKQNPGKWTYGAEGRLVIARSPKGAVIRPVPLPEDLRVSLDSPRPAIRVAAVEELAALLESPDAGVVLTVRTELTRIAAEDIPRVASAARAALPPLEEPRTLREGGIFHPRWGPPDLTADLGSKRLQVSVPDLGDFTDVPVIEILVSLGDHVDLEAPLVVLESDKATMEVPAPAAGRVTEIALQVGDRVSEGSPILVLAPSSTAESHTHQTPLGMVSTPPAGVQESFEVRVPDIGDFDSVPVAEVLVTRGDAVSVEDPLVVLESDKATMEIPSPSDGLIQDVLVKVGDQVSEGSVILVLRPVPGD